MAEKYPRDRFDDIPDGLQRVGAHRAPRPKGRGWIAVAWGALAVVVLVGAGIFGLSLVSGSISFHGTLNGASGTPTPTSTPTPTIVPTVDPALSVNVLNGTTTEGLGTKVKDVLTKAGWKVGAVANADQQNLTKTIVYYSDPKNEAAALGLAGSLPGATIEASQAFADTGADLTVVVGSDYTG
ncbi:LytR C-terminal domain-containing protein [Leifsonia sp. TF02-11]|uniref:LytR C-terminal domain-containing protein n=1 Tax=Leifsonia sp. TF02-11 TaxID=2815212 RepID=UPI001AA1A5EA|nr:LytR C-terminal domain-containing protein [Leifsonia sp. TF02-11]MBO1738882.1 LytR C-terminal domain-containing protein [Leifsonia sp. TF02-11]